MTLRHFDENLACVCVSEDLFVVTEEVACPGVCFRSLGFRRTFSLHVLESASTCDRGRVVSGTAAQCRREERPEVVLRCRGQHIEAQRGRLELKRKRRERCGRHHNLDPDNSRILLRYDSGG